MDKVKVNFCYEYRIGSGIYILNLDWDKEIKPGQFIMLESKTGLNRPFSAGGWTSKEFTYFLKWWEKIQCIIPN